MNTVTDSQSRQLVKVASIHIYYVRVFYMLDDDSFYMEWRMPNSGSGNVNSVTGVKTFQNADDCNCSWRFCVEELAKHFGAEVVVRPPDAPKRIAHPVELKRISA